MYADLQRYLVEVIRVRARLLLAVVLPFRPFVENLGMTSCGCPKDHFRGTKGAISGCPHPHARSSSHELIGKGVHFDALRVCISSLHALIFAAGPIPAHPSNTRVRREANARV